jgi:hypothetical protein
MRIKTLAATMNTDHSLPCKWNAQDMQASTAGPEYEDLHTFELEGFLYLHM